MGVDSKKAVPPLPAPTESDSLGNETEVATELSRATDKTSYSVPEDGSPITISTRRRREKDAEAKDGSQTSLLIEYFEAGKGNHTTTRRPSIRVKVTPSSKSRGRSSKEPHHIEITERSSGSRKPSYTKRINLAPNTRGDKLFGEDLDGKSVNSYSSLTEESNLTSRSGIHPVDIEVSAPGRHGSPLIPTGERDSRLQQLDSNVSSMPADSFLDGRSPERRRSRSLSRGEVLVGGAAAGLATGAIADHLKSPTRRRSRSLSRERLGKKVEISEKSHRDKSERRQKHRESRSRSVSNSEKYGDSSVTSPRRRSSRNHNDDSLVSGVDSSYLTTSRVSNDARSYRSGTSKASSINNPKLLETVEDAIRRLILPELTALKKEQKANANRLQFERDRRGSMTDGSSALSRESREEKTIRKVSNRSSAPEVAGTSRDVELHGGNGKLRKTYNPDYSELSNETNSEIFEQRSAEKDTMKDDKRSHGRSGREKKSNSGALAVGAGVGALATTALHGFKTRDGLSEREERRRRRKERGRTESIDESREAVNEKPRMPMMSDVTASDMTRTSILSADTDRPHYDSEGQLTPVHEVNRGYISPGTSTPTDIQQPTLQYLGVKHANRSIADLGASNSFVDEQQRFAHDHPGNSDLTSSTYDGSFIEDHHEFRANDHSYDKRNDQNTLEGSLAAEAAEAALLRSTHNDMQDEEEQSQRFPHGQGVSQKVDSHQPEEQYGRSYLQTVPAPLKYIPYNQERRGLSPIPQSVSSYREDENQHIDSRTNRSASFSTINESARSKNMNDTRSHDFAEVRQGGLTDSELTINSDNDNSKHHDDQHYDYDDQSYLTESNLNSKRNTMYDHSSIMGDDSLSGVQKVQAIGTTPAFVHPPVGVESNVASLDSATVMTGSNVTGDARRPQARRVASNASFEEGSEQNFSSRGYSPTKGDRMSMDDGYDGSDLESQSYSPSKYPEYELDDHGRKVTMPDYKNNSSHSTERAVGTMGAATAAAAAAIARYAKHKPQVIRSQYQENSVTGENAVPQRNRSFKERATEFHDSKQDSNGAPDAQHHEEVKFGASGLPDMHDPMPEIGHYQDDISDQGSVIRESQRARAEDDWAGRTSLTQKRQTYQHDSQSGQNTPTLRSAELATLAAAGGMGAAAALAQHERETDHVHNDDWHRTSEEKKRDTVVTNPYEGQSPAAVDQFADRNLVYSFDSSYGVEKLNYESKDEGYISSAPTQMPQTSIRRKEVGFSGSAAQMSGGNGLGNDPFYTPRLSEEPKGLARGHGSPHGFDAALGTGMDKIQNKDIVALMDHLTVRDAQRSARDTEILMTLVQAAAEMRNSFVEMRKLILDSEDVIIQEVERNTDRSIQKAINGPRPLPQSRPRSIKAGSQDEYMNDIPAKRRNVFRRALAGLSSKSSHDLAHIEDMLVRLLGDVEGLKTAQQMRAQGRDEYDDDAQEGNIEQDKGYEPEGHAGSSLTSHPSRSGQFSNLSRSAIATRPLEQTRKFSENRISTVHEGDEDEELDSRDQALLDSQFERNEQLMTPKRESRGGSVPLMTPPQQAVDSVSQSNDNTPVNEKSKKHKSSGSSGWIPKISRWSETTASTVANKFKRNSKQKDYEYSHSRSGSLDPYGDVEQNDREDPDYYSVDGDHREVTREQHGTGMRDMLPLPEEEPKYTAQRHSLLIAHPQPTHGPTAVHRSHLEGAAHTFGPVSPQSVDWGSSTSVNRLPPNPNSVAFFQQNTAPLQTRSKSALSDYDYDSPNAYVKAGQTTGPARPPKEPLISEPLNQNPVQTKSYELSKPSPLSNEHDSRVDDESRRYSGASASEERTVHVASPVSHLRSPIQQSPRSLSGKLAVPARKPTGPRSMGSSPRAAGVQGPRAMTPEPKGGNRENYGSVRSQKSYRTDDTETF